jgi:hypothetical protein
MMTPAFDHQPYFALPAVPLQEVTPQWMLPNKCFATALRNNTAGSAEPDISNFGPICRGAAAASRDPECAGVTAQQPRYNCSFKSLSSFWQVGMLLIDVTWL